MTHLTDRLTQEPVAPRPEVISFFEFVKFVTRGLNLPDYIHSNCALWYAPKQLNDLLEIVANRCSGKTLFSTLLIPTWELINNPSLEIGVLSHTYSQALMAEKSLNDLLITPAMLSRFPRLTGAKRPWHFPTNGHTLGHRLDYLIIDDAFPRHEYYYLNSLKRLDSWYRTSVLTRLTEDCRILYIASDPCPIDLR